ncbi:MAG TPA: DNA polymerase I [Planctomycetaceae bacterium]|nr:DNA polymerase I [Planctomycetaceae bacterium]
MLFGDDESGSSARPDPPVAATREPLDPTRPDFLAGRSVWIVDAYAVIYQVFHALAGAEMSSPRGEPVAAVHGFLRDMLDLLEKRKPDFLFCAFDPPGGTFRDGLYDAYKANRESMPVDLRDQIGKIRRLLEAFRLPIVEVPGFEADDVLATMARIVEGHGGRCLLVTSDKDCRQLLTDQVRMFNLRKGIEYGAAELATDWGIRPDQVIDFQSLVGDSVDNIPGVPGIGPKTATELLGKYGTLEGIYEHLDEISGNKRRENLAQGRESAEMSRRLVRLETEVPLTIDWELGRADHFDGRGAIELCREFGFRSLRERLERLLPRWGQESGTVAADRSESAGEPNDQAIAEDELPWEAEYRSVTDEEQLTELLAALAGAERISIDTETTSTRPRFASLVGLSLCREAGRAWYVPIRAPDGTPRLAWERVREALRPLLTDPSVEKIGQNLKYDLIVLRHHGLETIGPWFDTLVADYLLDPGQRNHGIDELSLRHLKHRTIPITALIGTGKSQKLMDEVPLPAITDYAAEDADVPMRLREPLGSRLDDSGLGPLMREVEMPLIDVLVDMESTGIAVDRSVLDRLGDELARRIADHERAIYEAAGEEFNIDSRLQLSRILFEKLGLPILRKTKTGPSTDAEVLAELAPLHPLPARLLEYRQDSKLKNTYVDTLPELIHPQTRRIHTSFMQDVAATGRLSSKDPNLQNIPVRTETGRLIRGAFVAGEPDWLLLSADYSQIELRVLAHFTGDAALREAFLADADIHAIVAAEVAGVPLAEVTSELRRKAKAVNFGILYGQSAFGLSRSLGIPQEEAAEFIEKYFARYPTVDRFIEATLDAAERDKQVATILGRRRLIDGIRPAEKRDKSRSRNLSERIAVNTVVQGSAADIIKVAMLRVHEWLRRANLRARLLLQIHDELLFECHPDDLAALTAGTVERMAGAIELSVPLKVDTKAGRTWADCT